MLHTLFENLADGDAIAEAALTSIYLPVAANMAADMNCKMCIRDRYNGIREED